MKMDHFDGLSDELLFLIFSKILDAQSLCRCSVVSKRFASLVPMVDSILLAVPPPNSNSNSKSNPSPFLNFIAKPLIQFLHQIVLPHYSSLGFRSNENSIHRFPSEVLKKFSHITSLRIRLPRHGGELGADGSVSFLKWEAEFGRELESCLVLGAKSSRKTNKLSRILELNESGLAAGDLKLRVAWMISCLLAASARHSLVKQIVVADNLIMLRALVIEDGSKQGRLRMGENQLKELRKRVKLQSPLERTKLPGISIKMWYSPLLEVSDSGSVMKGATVVVIRPVDRETVMKSDGDLLAGTFDGDEEGEGFCEAVKELVKEKKPYLMEMDSF